MMLGATITIILGLAVFEVVSSIDNAIINAEVLHTLSPKAKRWFLVWGLLLAVVVVRGGLPWLIVWLATPDIGPIQALTATASSSPVVVLALNTAAPSLLIGGGTILLFLFIHWLFLEEKSFGLPHERVTSRFGIAFYPIAFGVLAIVIWNAALLDPRMAVGAFIGAAVFLLTQGMKWFAERQETRLLDRTKTGRSDLAKLIYLELIDATFSIDGVLGAFAFTLSVPLILLGNGIGALVVRQLTVGNIARIKRLTYLKNGAMYSIFALGCVMLADSFGATLPDWLSPAITFIIVGYFYWKSVRFQSVSSM